MERTLLWAGPAAFARLFPHHSEPPQCACQEQPARVVPNILFYSNSGGTEFQASQGDRNRLCHIRVTEELPAIAAHHSSAWLSTIAQTRVLVTPHSGCSGLTLPLIPSQWQRPNFLLTPTTPAASDESITSQAFHLPVVVLFAQTEHHTDRNVCSHQNAFKCLIRECRIY